MLTKIIDLCRRYGIHLNPRLSQHFLHASHIIDLEISYAQINERDVVLDIGAGFGFLTEKLAQKAKRVYAIELDRKISRVLRDRLSEYIREDRIIVIEGDALKVELPEDVNKIVSNPPFHIISPLIFRLARTYFMKPDFDLCVLIVQLDYAYKMIAKPGEKRSRISATIQYFAEIELLSKVSRRNFFPIPDVDSAIIRLKPLRKKHLVDFETYKEIITMLFNTPNRRLGKIIKSRFEKNIAVNILKKLESIGIDSRKRIRELTNDELEHVAYILKGVLG